MSYYSAGRLGVVVGRLVWWYKATREARKKEKEMGKDAKIMCHVGGIMIIMAPFCR